ncbi:DNA-binding transcriptional regulator LsrR (DeoR family) [Xanthomonas sp. 3272]|uniref:Crp/Fnr family transcriptional regulator n=1 Tax=Xanthomonas arboricola TaxID=56448 RepID=UPI0016AB730B|nr:helix-turn-helix domain-containing protein [Xanthomonas arboricola]NJC00373.1 DNA-binding transcriptional regulator LsrR (DeoR family) [Xanthomonas arboricola]
MLTLSADLNWIEANQARSLERRLAAQLLTAQPSIRMPQSALADRLGVSRPTVNRLLKAWKAQGLIDVGYGKVNVLNMDALAAILAGERERD